MKEELLHYVWKHQLIKFDCLQTTNDERIEILYVGNYNTNEGADFLEARLKIDNTLLVGNIEIHLFASDWKRHQHQVNNKYNNVILHIVWINDEPLEYVPTLELNGKVSQLLLQKYAYLMQHSTPVPCAKSWNDIKHINIVNIQERMLYERLEHKSEKIIVQYNLLNKDWLLTKYYLLLQSIGTTINSFGFEQLTQRLEYKILIKHADNLLQIEALLFGTAGFLEASFLEDIYYNKLKSEYAFLKEKYGLVSMNKSIWNFLRMRPANFPTVKIALLAKLIYHSPQLFHLQNVDDTKDFLSTIVASEYWNTHYQFGKNSSFLPKKFGEKSIQALLINYNIPVFYTYQKYFEQQDVLQACIESYEKMSFEQNHKVKYFLEYEQTKTAADSQFLLELYNEYCSKRKCMQCKIAYQILKNETKNVEATI